MCVWGEQGAVLPQFPVSREGTFSAAVGGGGWWGGGDGREREGGARINPGIAGGDRAGRGAAATATTIAGARWVLVVPWRLRPLPRGGGELPREPTPTPHRLAQPRGYGRSVGVGRPCGGGAEPRGGSGEWGGPAGRWPVSCVIRHRSAVPWVRGSVRPRALPTGRHGEGSGAAGGRWSGGALLRARWPVRRWGGLSSGAGGEGWYWKMKRRPSWLGRK